MKRTLILIMTLALTTWSLRAGVNPQITEAYMNIVGFTDDPDGKEASPGDFIALGSRKEIKCWVNVAGRASLSWVSTKIEVYDSATGGTPLPTKTASSSAGYKYEFDATTTPRSFFIKGVDVSDGLAEETLLFEALHVEPYPHDIVAFTVVRLDSIWAIKPDPNERMESFPPHVSVNCSAFSIVNPGRHLPVFRNDSNHDSVLAALMMTPDMFDTYDANVSVTWRKISGPDSGDFNETDKMLVRYENPTIGGIYKLGFDFGLGTPESQVNIVLPLAGANMMTWLGSERRYIEDYAPQHKAETRADCIEMNPLLAVEPLLLELEMTVSFANLSAYDFDYSMYPVNASRQAPFQRYAANNFYWYVTLRDVVVHGSKINNMLWGLFSRGWGWTEAEIRAGAHLNQLARTLRMDGVGSQNALGLGFELHTRSSELTSDILTESLITSIQDPALDEEIFWPCSDPADGNENSFVRPSLRTTQYD